MNTAILTRKPRSCHHNKSHYAGPFIVLFLIIAIAGKAKYVKVLFSVSEASYDAASRSFYGFWGNARKTGIGANNVRIPGSEGA